MYAFLSPTTMDEAVEMLRVKKGLRILSGGTDLIIALKDRITACDYLMDCKRIPELQVLEVTGQGLEIGAAVPLNRLLDSGLLTPPYRAMEQGAKELANVLLRNRATLSGNICNASPGGDMLAPCLVLDGWVETASPSGGRKIPLKEFFTGVKKHVLGDDEMVVKTVIPPTAGVSAYRKRKRIRGHDLAQVGVAGFYGEDGALRLAFGAVGPTPVLMDDLGVYTKTRLKEQKAGILKRVAGGISPISDIRSTKEYRVEMARYLTGLILDEFSGEGKLEA